MSAAADQLERAQKRWALVVLALPGDRSEQRQLRRVLRVKSFEADAFRERIPGPVRFGARVDLEPLLERLLALGVQAELRDTLAAES